jgi:hypothetical protein
MDFGMKVQLEGRRVISLALLPDTVVMYTTRHSETMNICIEDTVNSYHLAAPIRLWSSARTTDDNAARKGPFSSAAGNPMAVLCLHFPLTDSSIAQEPPVTLQAMNGYTMPFELCSGVPVNKQFHLTWCS